MLKFLYDAILKKLIRFDFINDISEKEEIGAYLKMKDESIMKLLKYLYTNKYASYLIANDRIKDIVKGEVMCYLRLINAIEGINETMLNPKTYQEKRKKREVLGNIKNKFYNKPHRSVEDKKWIDNFFR
jgi:hypothetical protein